MDNSKLENMLNLALDATEAEREKSLNLDVGYDRQERTWELIVKYSGTIGRLADERALQVDNDQVGAARALTRHLLQTGVRRIAYLSGRINYTVNVDRLLGFHQALKEYGVPPAPELVFSDVETPEKRLDALAAVLERRPECILCGDDSLAFDLLKDLRRRGVCVPGDIRLASLYDSEILLDTTPTVTAVQFDAEALGTAACRLLLDAMSGREVVPRQVQGFQVVLREST